MNYYSSILGATFVTLLLVLSSAATHAIGDNTTYVTQQQCHDDMGQLLGFISLLSGNVTKIDPKKLYRFALDICEYTKQNLGYYIIFSGGEASDGQKALDNFEESQTRLGINTSQAFQDYLISKGYPADMTNFAFK